MSISWRYVTSILILSSVYSLIHTFRGTVTMAKATAAKRRKRTARAKASRANGTVNKAQAIRDAAKKLGRKVRPKDIIAALAAEGITVSSPQVSATLKAAGYRRSRAPAARQRPGRAAQAGRSKCRSSICWRPRRWRTSWAASKPRRRRSKCLTKLA